MSNATGLYTVDVDRWLSVRRPEDEPEERGAGAIQWVPERKERTPFSRRLIFAFLLLALWIAHSNSEATAFRQVTGVRVSILQAMFLNLTVSAPAALPGSDEKTIERKDTNSEQPNRSNRPNSERQRT